MEFEISKKFEKQVYKIKDPIARKRLKNIFDTVKVVDNITDIPNVKAIVNFSGYYRIKFGDYRVGISLEGNTIWFLFFGKRDENTYKKFP